MNKYLRPGHLVLGLFGRGTREDEPRQQQVRHVVAEPGGHRLAALLFDLREDKVGQQVLQRANGRGARAADVISVALFQRKVVRYLARGVFSLWAWNFRSRAPPAHSRHVLPTLPRKYGEEKLAGQSEGGGVGGRRRAAAVSRSRGGRGQGRKGEAAREGVRAQIQKSLKGAHKYTRERERAQIHRGWRESTDTSIT